MIDLVRENTDSLFVLAFEEDQYIPAVREEFNEKYGGNVVEITPEEIREVSDDLVTLYLLPEDMNWIILRDHDGSILLQRNKRTGRTKIPVKNK